MRINSFGMICIGNVGISIFSVISIICLLIYESPLYSLLVISTIAIHELSHLLIMYIYGCKINALHIYPFGIDIKTDTCHISYNKEALIMLSGSIANITCCLICIPFLSTHFSKELLFFTFLNLFLGITNLLPVNSLDGGRALQAILCSYLSLDKALFISNLISNLSYFLLCLICVFLFEFTNFNLSFILLVIYICICAFIAQKVIK